MIGLSTPISSKAKRRLPWYFQTDGLVRLIHHYLTLPCMMLKVQNILTPLHAI